MLQTLFSSLYQWLTFILLLLVYLLAEIIGFFGSKLKILCSKFQVLSSMFNVLNSWCSSFYRKITGLLDIGRDSSISRVDLIDLSVKNMRAKKNRTAVTIGGMMIGIGAIVFLVSLGYGLQEVVVGRVARLEEMRQADVTPQTGGKLKINDKTLADFNSLSAVESSLPLIAVVGRVGYQNSVSDMAVYGVTTDYLGQSAIKPVQGKIFESNELVVSNDERPGENEGEVAGESVRRGEEGEEIGAVEFTINPGAWIRVRESPSTAAKILGYTKRTEGVSSGVEIWGGNYESDDEAGKAGPPAGEAGETENGQILGKWIKAPVLLWQKEECDPGSEGDCEEGEYLVMRDEENKQVQKEGYFAEINLKVSGVDIAQNSKVKIQNLEGSVLGEEVSATKSAEISKSIDIGWVEIASEAGIISPPETKTVELTGEAKRQAVVNRAMLKVLGINEAEAVGKKFNVSFVVVGDLLEDEKEKVESASTEYTIVGVTPEEKSPLFYVPFIDLRSLGIVNYSQVKLVVKNQQDLARTRQQVEAMGYVTTSVVDTVEQINSLFATLRTALLALGLVALAVAALGMFNTLTVSLLERTREVGLMKAMGMKSSEVHELFLTESMMMGFLGGLLGIVLGVVLGKLTGLGLSVFAVFKGVGFLDVSYVPFSFALAVIFLSFLVGITTGIYPARRASKISALNALRYE